jgi:omega-amidase
MDKTNPHINHQEGTKMKIVVIHMKVRGTVKDNLTAAQNAITKAAAQKPALIALPEYFTVPNCMENFTNAQSISKQTQTQTIKFLKEVSKKHPDTFILGGTYLEEDQGKYYNTNTLWKNGSLIAKYKKINPIQGELNAGVAKGNQPLVVETEIGKIGLLVCADMFDPELVKKTAALGAEIVSLPVAAMGTHPSVKGHPLTEKVASDNGLFVVKVGNVCSSTKGGRSAVIAPWGILTEVSDVPEDQLLTADLDMKRLKEYRSKLSKS